MPSYNKGTSFTKSLTNAGTSSRPATRRNTDSVLGAMEDKAATELTLTAYDDAVMKQASTKLESNQFVAFGVKLTR